MPSASGTQNGAPASSRPPVRPSPPADNDPNPDTDPDLVLAAERAHLLAARQFLRLMRENVLSLEALGGDRVSVEYLKANLHRRAESLHDLPDTPLFFGRLDYSDEITWPDSNAGASQQIGDQPDGGQPGGGQPGGGQPGSGQLGGGQPGGERASGRLGGGQPGGGQPGGEGAGGQSGGEASRVEFGSAFPGEQFHIGRRHVHDPEGHPVVIDWRAPGIESPGAGMITRDPASCRTERAGARPGAM